MMWADLLERYTSLSITQQSLIMRLWEYVEFGQHISEQGISLVLECTDGNLLVLGDLHKKILSDIQPIAIPIDDPLRVTLRGNTSYQGKMTYDDIDYYYFSYPIVDNGGKCIGSCFFTFPQQDVYRDDFVRTLHVMSQTTFQAMLVPQQKQMELYQSVSPLDGVIIFNQSGMIIYANRSAKKLSDLLGIDRRLEGTSIYSSTLKISRIKKALEEQMGTMDEELYGSMALRQIVIPVPFGVKEKRGILILQDRTSVRKQEQELLVKNSVIKEIHHRVKNNLQSVAGLLRMQSRRSESSEVERALQDSIHRIESMALVHEVVSNYNEDYLSLRTIGEELWRLLRQGLGHDKQDIHFHYDGSDMIMSSHKASYMSLVLNELFSNIFKHAFKEDEQGFVKLSVDLIKENEEDIVCIRLEDSGCGLPSDFKDKRRQRLGLQIIENLVINELCGTIEWMGSYAGTLVEIRLEKGEEYASITSR